MSNLADTNDYTINYENITYISYKKVGGQRLATIHFIGGDELDVTDEEAGSILIDSDKDSIEALTSVLENFSEELIMKLMGRLDDIIRAIACR
tara:strand:+ start:331 stop:609 length:279 start_codon:yes stop_codon:yes gene_type:complete